MKQKTGKKIGKILLLVILAAVVGVIVYTALTWPVNPDRQKPAESDQLMKQAAEDLGVLAPPEDVLPWTQPEYDFWLANTWRFARPCGYTMAGDISYISRLCDQNNIPFASNIATAEVLVLGLARGDLDWRCIVNPSNRPIA